jgi:hypothetical protein
MYAALKKQENVSALGNACVHLLSGLVIEEVGGGGSFGRAVIISVKERGKYHLLGAVGSHPVMGDPEKELRLDWLTA